MFPLDEIQYIYNGLVIYYFPIKKVVKMGYCPKCGYEVKEGHRFCFNCGTEIQTASDSFQEQVAQTPTANAPVPVQQPVYNQTQEYAVVQPKKSNIKLIAAILAVVAIVIVVLVLVVFLFGKGSSNPSDFVGTWTLDSMQVNGSGISIPSGITITFNSDGTYQSTSVGSTQSGEWEIKDGKLSDSSSNSNSPFNTYSWSYQFSDGGNTLTMSCFASTENYTVQYVFKKSSSSNNNGGTSHELDDGLVGNWNITSVSYNEQSTSSSGTTIDFNSDGTYTLVYSSYSTENGTWYVSGGKLYLQASSGYSMLSSSMAMDYSLSNGGNTLTFGYSISYGDDTYTVEYIFEKL